MRTGRFFHAVHRTYKAIPGEIPWRGLDAEEVAIRLVRHGCPTKTTLYEVVTLWLAGGPRHAVPLNNHIKSYPIARAAVNRLLVAGIILRDPKWPHHLKLGV